jgi:transcriptional regulator GlxA family with amidase domain
MDLPVVRIGEDMQLVSLLNEMRTSLERGSAYPNLLCASHALGHLLALAIRHRQDAQPEQPEALTKIGQTIVYMSEHLDHPLRVGDLAALINVSPAHFTVLFRQATGSSPRDYLHLLRLHRACHLLRNSKLSLKQIAAQLGYQDPFHFSRQFKALQGISPSQYRDSQDASAAV